MSRREAESRQLRLRRHLICLRRSQQIRQDTQPRARPHQPNAAHEIRRVERELERDGPAERMPDDTRADQPTPLDLRAHERRIVGDRRSIRPRLLDQRAMPWQVERHTGNIGQRGDHLRPGLRAIS